MDLSGLATLVAGIVFFGAGVPCALAVLSVWVRRQRLAWELYACAWALAIVVVAGVSFSLGSDFLLGPGRTPDLHLVVTFFILCIAPLLRRVVWGAQAAVVKAGICLAIVGGPPCLVAAFDRFIGVDRYGPAPDDPGDAVAYYRRHCWFGDAEIRSGACAQLGRRYELGQGVRQDLPRAVQLYRGACASSDPIGCYYLGHAYEDGIVMEQDSSRAAELYRKACSEARIAQACFRLGDLHSRGAGVSHDDSSAMDLFKRACDLHDERGCVRLGLSYANAVGAQKDDTAAVDLFRGACHGHGLSGTSQPDACYYLVLMYASGWGVTANPGEARSLLERACAGGIQEACAPPGRVKAMVPR
jgi:hypothetical protein